MTAAAFYLFAVGAIAGGVFCVTSRSALQALVWLVLAFVSAAGLFVLLGAAWIATLMIFLYVGAVGVVLISALMMRDLEAGAEAPARGWLLPATLLIGAVAVMQVVVSFGSWEASPASEGLRALLPEPGGPDSAVMGRALFTEYFLAFHLMGLILLVALLGAAMLALRERPAQKPKEPPARLLRGPIPPRTLRGADLGRRQ